MRFFTLVGTRVRAVLAIVTSAGAGDADKIPATNASGFLDPTLLNATNSSAGAGDAGKLPQLDAAGRLSATMMPVGLGADTATIEASETLAASDLVNIWLDGATRKVRKADATTEGKEVHGFILAGAAAAANATVYFEGRLTGLTGLTPGAPQFMSTTPGARTAAPPSATGNVVQQVGIAVDATSMDFEPQLPITLG